ncbi:MAG: hypothetical protein NTW29_12725 [Bacteroidetes bacterium]|nr:hypothetical protein [Bacteroidota bacterium]
MNVSSSYEQLIAKKIAAIQVPDLQDSIWASIEAQLDIPLPVEEQPAPPARNPTGKGLPGTAKLIYVAIPAVLITAAVLLLFRNKKAKRKQTPVPQQLLPVEKKQDDSTIRMPVIPLPQKKGIFESQQDSTSVIPVATIPFTDSMLPVQLPDPKPDSATTSIAAPPPAQDTASQKTGVKKPKGIKGIRDTDYKIKAERKDSAGKKP